MGRGYQARPVLCANKIHLHAYATSTSPQEVFMELGYAFFLLLSYVILVLLGIFVYEHWETWRKRRQPIQIL